MVLVVVLFMMSIAIAGAQTPSPTPAGGEGTEEELARVPTEYFVYGAVGLLALLILGLGAGFVRTVQKTAENE